MQRIKRLFDLVIAVPSVIFLSPILVLIGFLVRLEIGSPVLFKQVRPGLQGRPFTIYKFRTMTDERDEDGGLLPDERRLTRLGCFLRKASLDELPELFNVLKRDMSIVGPRPLLMQYLERYTPEQAGVMKSSLGSPLGRRRMAGMLFPGKISFSWMCGMWIK